MSSLWPPGTGHASKHQAVAASSIARVAQASVHLSKELPPSMVRPVNPLSLGGCAFSTCVNGGQAWRGQEVSIGIPTCAEARWGGAGMGARGAGMWGGQAEVGVLPRPWKQRASAAADPACRARRSVCRAFPIRAHTAGLGARLASVPLPRGGAGPVPSRRPVRAECDTVARCEARVAGQQQQRVRGAMAAARAGDQPRPRRAWSQSRKMIDEVSTLPRCQQRHGSRRHRVWHHRPQRGGRGAGAVRPPPPCSIRAVGHGAVSST